MRIPDDRTGAGAAPEDGAPRSASLPTLGHLLVLGAFVVSRVVFLGFHLHHGPNLKEYRGWLQAAHAGRVPFVDFPIEYPPIAWWVMRSPGTTQAAAYDFRFRLIMGAADIGSFALLWWIVSRRRRRATLLVAAIYVACTIALEYVLYDSLDMLMLLAVLGGAAAWLRSETSAFPDSWRAVAYLSLAAGAAYKVIPIFALPFLVIGDLRTTADRRRVGWRAALALAGLAAPFAAAARTAGPGVLGFVRYHIARGLEIESTWATLVWITSRDPALHVASRFGSWELAGGLSAAFVALNWAAALGVLGALTWWALALKDRLDAGRNYLQILLALPAMLVVSKVFSTQYMLWAVPLLMLTAVEVAPDRRGLAAVGAASVAMAALSAVFYPFGIQYVAALSPWVMTVIALRNAIFLATVVWLVRLAVTRDRAIQAASGAPF
ncbi:MAG TPA: hypothetical protein VL309_04705 [Vicinamibacterales bacterium]|nr:hypothetical protein [Vicinamibacterales bacterium]